MLHIFADCIDDLSTQGGIEDFLGPSPGSSSWADLTWDALRLALPSGSRVAGQMTPRHRPEGRCRESSDGHTRTPSPHSATQ